LYYKGFFFNIQVQFLVITIFRSQNFYFNIFMIDAVLIHLRDSLNQYFKNLHGFDEHTVVISNIVDQNGASWLEVENKIVISLLSIGEEPSMKNNSSRVGAFDGSGFQSKNSILYLNMHVMFCVNFRNKKYLEGLNFLSHIISFYHRNRLIESRSIPGFSKKMQKISMELCTFSYDNMSHIWSSIGAKLMPSSIYKISLIPIDDSPMTGYIPAIKSSGEIK
tara:strand:+ start:394705 stop:395367 length:663 start_codon:yes stop_codon:yes gene_type:complete